jgi:hypothetical protein
MGYADNAETSGVELQGGRDSGVWIAAKNLEVARSLARWSGRPLSEVIEVMKDAPPPGPHARAHLPLRRFIEANSGAVAIRKHYDRLIALRRKMHVQDLALDPLLDE